MFEAGSPARVCGAWGAHLCAVLRAVADARAGVSGAVSVPSGCAAHDGKTAYGAVARASVGAGEGVVVERHPAHERASGAARGGDRRCAAPAFRDLTDGEVLAGIENAIRTYETLERGIIYEHRSESPRIQAVTESLIEVLKRVEEDSARRGARLQTSDEVACLHVLVESIRLMQDEREAQAYLRVAALFQPYPEPESRLIVVPR